MAARLPLAGGVAYPWDDIEGSEVWTGELGRTSMYADPEEVGMALATWAGGWNRNGRACKNIAAWLRVVADVVERPE